MATPTAPPPVAPEAPESTIDSAAISDGSKITDEVELQGIITQLTDALKRGLSGYRGMTTTLKTVASLRVRARRLILMANGHPDWSAKSDAYRMVIADAEESVLTLQKASSDEKRRINGAIRQHVSRTFLDPAILAYVRETGNNLGDASEDDDRLKSAVKAEYVASGLGVPEQWGGAPSGSGGGSGSGSTPENPAAVFSNTLGQAGGTVGNLTPLVVAVGLHRLMSNAAAVLVTTLQSAEGKVDDRPKVKHEYERVGAIAALLVKAIDGEATEADYTSLSSLYYNPSEDPKV